MRICKGTLSPGSLRHPTQAWYDGMEYGDWTCTMGSGSSFAAASRFVRGWFPEHSRAEMNQIPGIYTLSGLTKNPHEAQDGDRHTLQSDNLLVSYDDRVGAGQLSVHKQYGLYHVTIMQASASSASNPKPPSPSSGRKS